MLEITDERNFMGWWSCAVDISFLLIAAHSNIAMSVNILKQKF
jgi:hypothetical protein